MKSKEYSSKIRCGKDQKGYKIEKIWNRKEKEQEIYGIIRIWNRKNMVERILERQGVEKILNRKDIWVERI